MDIEEKDHLKSSAGESSSSERLLNPPEEVYMNEFPNRPADGLKMHDVERSVWQVTTSKENPEQPGVGKNNKSAKKRILKWDNTVNLSNVLTFITIISAAIGLYLQKKAVDVKVKDLQAVVNDLEEEKRKRELEGLEQNTSKLNGDNYNLNYTVTQLRAVGKIYDNQFIETIEQINTIINLLANSKIVPTNTIEQLKKMTLINEARREIYAHNIIYINKTEEFESQNEPREENYKTIDEYIVARQLYNDTLHKNTDRLLKKLDSLIQDPKNRLKKLYGQ
jgi:hypothetical protein